MTPQTFLFVFYTISLKLCTTEIIDIGILYLFDYILDCLRSFTDLEELDETELYYCHKCKKRQKSTKKFWIQKLPKVYEQKFSIPLLQSTNLSVCALRVK